MPRTKPTSSTESPQAQLGFEKQLWAAADKLRGNMEASEYKHVALGMIFLKYISDSFEAKYNELRNDDYADPEDPEEYLAENVFWVPPEARWSHLQANARQPSIGNVLDDAMLAIENYNEGLKGVLPKDYARPALNKIMLGELIDLIGEVGMGDTADRSRDILGRVYEYFLGGFAGAEGKRGGEFYTPRSVDRLYWNYKVYIPALAAHSGNRTSGGVSRMGKRRLADRATRITQPAGSRVNPWLHNVVVVKIM